MCLRKMATYKSVCPALSLSLTRPGLAPTHCCSSASFILQKPCSFIPYFFWAKPLLFNVLQACVVCMCICVERKCGAWEKAMRPSKGRIPPGQPSFLRALAFVVAWPSLPCNALAHPV